jgi:molecular chaperone HscA
VDQVNAATIVDNHVLEPMAAAAGITDHLSNQKPRILVADIGAGTSDFGAYQFVLPQQGRARAHPFKDSESALKQAGNRLDEFLIRMIVERSGTPAGSDAAIRIAKILMRNIRETKQSLFASGQVFVSVPDLFDLTISLFVGRIHSPS